MIRVYIIAADSLNPLTPAFKDIPKTELIAGIDRFDETEIPTAERLSEIVGECIDIAKTGQFKPPATKEKPPERQRAGQLDLNDSLMTNAGRDERFPPPPNEDEIPAIDDDLPF